MTESQEERQEQINAEVEEIIATVAKEHGVPIEVARLWGAEALAEIVHEMGGGKEREDESPVA